MSKKDGCRQMVIPEFEGMSQDKADSPTKEKRDLFFSDYDAFVEKFNPKKTTDDCYTPQNVFNAVVDYVNSFHDLSDKEVVRPFYPGGDYEKEVYTEKSVVIDNPPFSIISKIAKFYTERRIPFFIFAPHLTLFGVTADCTKVVVGAGITYDNGACVSTSFLTNLFDDVAVMGCPVLLEVLKEAQKNNKVSLPVYKYPANIATISNIQYIVSRGVPIEIKKNEAHHVRQLDSQKAYNKGIFGHGFMLSDRAAARQEAARQEAARQDNVIVWSLSEREKQIVKTLS